MNQAVVWLLALCQAMWLVGYSGAASSAPTPVVRQDAERIERPDLPEGVVRSWQRALDRALRPAPPPLHRPAPLLPLTELEPARQMDVPGGLLVRPDYSIKAKERRTAKPAPVAAPVAHPKAPGRRFAGGLPALAIIIDDIGHGLAQGRRVIELPAPVALAVLPHTQAATRLVEEALRAGKPVMLHLPMENQGGTSIGPGGLYAQMSEAEFRRVLVDNLNSLPGVQGVNNHMGSLLTTLRPQMDWLMGELAERKLFFVDSRTSALTQAATAAAARGIPHVSRHVFLDNLRTPEHLQLSFDGAVERARVEGYAVLIGHPYPETLGFLERRLVDLEKRERVRVVPVQTLLDRP